MPQSHLQKQSHTRNVSSSDADLIGNRRAVSCAGFRRTNKTQPRRVEDVNREGGTEAFNRRWLQCFVSLRFHFESNFTMSVSLKVTNSSAFWCSRSLYTPDIHEIK